MESCFRCGRNQKEVRLFDSIHEGQMESICERCSILDHIPVIRRPDSSQLKESEKNPGVYQRMRRMAGYFPQSSSDAAGRASVRDRLSELDRRPELERPESGRPNLVEHWYWHLQKLRRHRGLSQKQLAESVGESEVSIAMAEKGQLPGNAQEFIKKLEQFFQSSLSKRDLFKEMALAKARARAERTGPVLLDEEGNEVDFIPEPKIEVKPRQEGDGKNPIVTEMKSENLTGFPDEKMGDLDLRKADPKNINIKDMREMHRRRVEATKQEKFEEQKRIEDKRRVIEARKEEMRIAREKQSRELDTHLGGSELLKRKGSSTRDERDDYLNL